MELIYVLLGVLLVVAVYVLFFSCKRRDHFFGGHATVTVSWGVPESLNPLVYNWMVCNSTSCDADPTKWTNPVQSTATPTVVLDESNCPDCDFGQTLVVAVQAVDTVTQVQSAWATFTIDLSVPSATTQLLDAVTGTAPSNTTTNLSFVTSVDVTGLVTDKMNLELSIARGSTTYTFYTPIGVMPNNQSGAYVNLSDQKWSPSPPLSLQGGDTVTAVGAVFNSQNILYYTTPALAVDIPNSLAPPATSSFSYALNSA